MGSWAHARATCLPHAYHAAGVQALYAIDFLAGTLSPPKSAIEPDIAFTNFQCGDRYLVHRYMCNMLESEMVGYTDCLLEKFGLESRHVPEKERQKRGDSARIRQIHV